MAQCLLVYRELSEVKSAVESPLASGRRMVKERVASQPHTLSSQLDDLKAVYNKLGSEVTQLRGELEEAVQQARRLERDMAAADKVLTNTEENLKSKPTLATLQQCLDEMKHKRPLLTSVCESSNYLIGLAGGNSEGVQETVRHIELLQQRWESCTTALTEKIAEVGVSIAFFGLSYK